MFPNILFNYLVILLYKIADSFLYLYMRFNFYYYSKIFIFVNDHSSLLDVYSCLTFWTSYDIK